MRDKENFPKLTPLAMIAIGFITLASSLFTHENTSADPCGMVPPVQVNANDAIKRVGAQKTYLFYRDGIESFVVRPGFEGKVDNFGMLIPFPNVPSIRKVPNNIFPHITKAIDPPEIKVHLGQRLGANLPEEDIVPLKLSKGRNAKEDDVTVKRQEAVGMYQTAVLKAGSAKALKQWMDDHGYSYPNNMDQAANDYVDAGWCFVAVKARVGSKNAVNPKPGMRQADTDLPEGATFDGNVQAMGFRFRSDHLVAPMRLSAYNDGKLHNITYVLTDEPKRINHISQDKIKRQVSGKQLYQNVTALPVRVIGGTWEDLPDYRKKWVQQHRDPDPMNGRAKELFRSDLLAARKDRLVHGYEKDIKALLDIEEALNLRGEHIDDLNREYVSNKNKRVRQHALKGLKDMTLTIIDGEFPRDVLKRENLTFSTYQMPEEQNTSSAYNAREKGPVQYEENSTLYRGKKLKPVKKQGGFNIQLFVLFLLITLTLGGVSIYGILQNSATNAKSGSS